MTRNTIIDSNVKNIVIHQFQNRKALGLNQKMIAQRVNISERSVKRILDEAGLATAVPLIKGEARQTMYLLKAYEVNMAQLHEMLAMRKSGPTRGQIVKAVVDMDESAWGSILREIVTARVAKNSNNMVATAMLNISNAVDKNAKPGNN
jgi:DNA-binding XRE family transcriptional regulator